MILFKIRFQNQVSDSFPSVIAEHPCEPHITTPRAATTAPAAPEWLEYFKSHSSLGWWGWGGSPTFSAPEIQPLFTVNRIPFNVSSYLYAVVVYHLTSFATGCRFTVGIKWKCGLVVVISHLIQYSCSWWACSPNAAFLRQPITVRAFNSPVMKYNSSRQLMQNLLQHTRLAAFLSEEKYQDISIIL